jgi:hypothetical protein
VLNIVLRKTIGTLIAYAQTLKSFTNFIESWGPFFNTLFFQDNLNMRFIKLEVAIFTTLKLKWLTRKMLRCFKRWRNLSLHPYFFTIAQMSALVI